MSSGVRTSEVKVPYVKSLAMPLKEISMSEWVCGFIMMTSLGKHYWKQQKWWNRRTNTCFGRFNLEERPQMGQLREQWEVWDRFYSQMVLLSTGEKLAWGGRRQQSNLSVHSTASVGIAVSLGLQQVDQLTCGKKSCIMVNTGESEIASNDRALLPSFLLNGMLWDFQSLCCLLEWERGEW